MPIVTREISQMSRLLEMAQGEDGIEDSNDYDGIEREETDDEDWQTYDDQMNVTKERLRNRSANVMKAYMNNEIRRKNCGQKSIVIHIRSVTNHRPFPCQKCPP
ncbi:hypothetical protein CBL_05164 [Carabus blaptoides fortunei]